MGLLLIAGIALLAAASLQRFALPPPGELLPVLRLEPAAAHGAHHGGSRPR